MSAIDRLTEPQKAVYGYIRQSILERGFAPTVREVTEEFGWSINGATCHLKALERRGVIEREPNVSRGIRLTLERLTLVPAGAEPEPAGA